MNFPKTPMRAAIAIVAMFLLASVMTERASAQLLGPKRREPVSMEKLRPRPPRAQADFWEVPDKGIADKAHLGKFASTIAKTNVSYLYYLPPGYDANRLTRYPVIYWLPGLGGDCRETGRMLNKFDDAINAKICPPVIVIGVQGVYGSMYTDAIDGGRPVESVIIKELIDHVDKSYRTIPRAESRGIEGYAMGGYGAAHLAFKHPDLFGVVSILAAPMGTLKAFQAEAPDMSADVWGDDQKYFSDNDPYELVLRNQEKIRGKMKIRLICGSDDRYRLFTDDLHDQMLYIKIDHDYRIVTGAKHNLAQLLGPLGKDAFAFWQDTLSTTSPASGAAPVGTK